MKIVPDITNIEFGMWFFIGILLFSFYEYAVHRFVFHGEDTWMEYVPFNKYVYTFHFLMHGIHHAFP